MRQEEINENKKLIAEFDNIPTVDDTAYPGIICYWYEEYNRSYREDELLYDSDWNWIMPVVARISSVVSNWESGTIERKHFDNIFYADHMFSEFMNDGINGVCKRVIDFIKWYNSKK